MLASKRRSCWRGHDRSRTVPQPNTSFDLPLECAASVREDRGDGRKLPVMNFCKEAFYNGADRTEREIPKVRHLSIGGQTLLAVNLNSARQKIDIWSGEMINARANLNAIERRSITPCTKWLGYVSNVQIEDRFFAAL